MAGIYLHIPFCKQACYYCDFHFSTSLKHKESIIMAIKQELVLRKDELREPVKTIYFGGGTPSLLEANEIRDILSVIDNNFTTEKEVEITLEANPDDLTKEKLIHLSHTQINRLSIGVQSFFDDDLKLMNRAHSAKESLQSLKWAKSYYNNISIDLIYGLPEMSDKKWLENLNQFLALEIPHLSSYALTVENNTALANFINKGKLKPLDEAMAAKHFELLNEVMINHGLLPYETSNFAKEGYLSQHNTSYWQGKAYLGVGPSAHSFDGQLCRRWNVSNNIKYLKGINTQTKYFEKEYLTKADKFNELILTRLRTIWGVSLTQVEKEFGLKFLNFLEKEIQHHLQQNHLKINDNHLIITQKGKFFADGIASDLFMLEE